MIKEPSASPTGAISFWHPASLIATCFGIGKIPFMPGTWGSLAAFPIFIPFTFWFMTSGVWHAMSAYNPGAVQVHSLAWVLITLMWLLVISILFGLGTWASHVYMKKTGQTDPSEIVIDEVIAQLLIFTFLSPLLNYLPHANPALTLILLGVSFLLFRIFDIFKPWPVSWADRNVKGALGVMLDDLLAALYVILIMGLSLLKLGLPS